MPKKVLGKKFLTGKLQALGLVASSAATSRTLNSDGVTSPTNSATSVTSPVNRQVSVFGNSSARASAPEALSAAASKSTKKDLKKLKNLKKPVKYGREIETLDIKSQTSSSQASSRNAQCNSSEFAKSWVEEYNAGSSSTRSQSEDDADFNVDQISIPERPGTPSKMSVQSLPTDKRTTSSAPDDALRFPSPQLKRSRSFRLGEQDYRLVLVCQVVPMFLRDLQLWRLLR